MLMPVAHTLAELLLWLDLIVHTQYRLQQPLFMLWAPLLVDIHNAPAQTLFQLAAGGKQETGPDKEDASDGSLDKVSKQPAAVMQLLRVAVCLPSKNSALMPGPRLCCYTGGATPWSTCWRCSDQWQRQQGPHLRSSSTHPDCPSPQ
jgi:hypothetical protein